jgi:hypothetical protein
MSVVNCPLGLVRLVGPVPRTIIAVVDFVADRSGLFEVETHDSARLLTQLLVR